MAVLKTGILQATVKYIIGGILPIFENVEWN